MPTKSENAQISVPTNKLPLYTSQIRSIIDYGEPVYNLSNQSQLKTSRHRSKCKLRLGLRAFWTSLALRFCALCRGTLPPLSFRGSPSTIYIKLFNYLETSLENFLNSTPFHNTIPSIIFDTSFWLPSTPKCNVDLQLFKRYQYYNYILLPSHRNRQKIHRTSYIFKPSSSASKLCSIYQNHHLSAFSGNIYSHAKKEEDWTQKKLQKKDVFTQPIIWITQCKHTQKVQNIHAKK